MPTADDEIIANLRRAYDVAEEARIAVRERRLEAQRALDEIREDEERATRKRNQVREVLAKFGVRLGANVDAKTLTQYAIAPPKATLDRVLIVLRESSSPLKPAEVLQDLSRRSWVEREWKAPAQTVYAALKRAAEHGFAERDNDGRWSLVSKPTTDPPAQVAEDDQSEAKASDDWERKLTGADEWDQAQTEGGG
ncbi:hypothetical protein [Parafrankia sp. EUN1f]|uniref:hypothetical protein n=1 Tax=Parafrankia sp. EUN1f TaxID=102897 RepID=UPI0001C44A6D|nr:hypothetical protein [Parafrankia sp. EUN1f]EFC84484.1 hypothetical protein FrEUN1fDRAFT_2414 [Parafrankia sp. EUN1f]